tara:strand:+ start:4648 stop:5205 length:558 start_codon:yes stop_codon:yes gene_type:complete
MDKFEQLKQKNWVSLFLLNETELLNLCRVDNFLSSKPGGQHRDKKASSVRLTLFNGDIVTTSSDSRSYQANQKYAVNRLKIEIICKYRSEISIKKCINLFHLEQYFTDAWLVKNGRINIAANNKNYLIFAAIILDSLYIHEWNFRIVGKIFGVTTSHLVKFLSKEKKLFVFVNMERQKLGMRPYN